MSDYFHYASWRGTRIGNGAGGRQHRDVESQSDVLFSCCVHAFNVICLRLVRDQLRMLLYDENEARLPLKRIPNFRTLEQSEGTSISCTVSHLTERLTFT